MICNKKKLIETSISYKNLILYGAGKRLLNYHQMFKDTLLSERDFYLVDSDIHKQGTKINVFDKECIIYGKGLCDELKEQNTLVIIICANYSEIYDELVFQKGWSDENIVCLTHIIAIESEENAMAIEMPKLTIKNKVEKIPRKIHYAWFGGKEIPDQYKRWMESWYKFCPDYEIIQWNEDNYDISKNRYMEEAYRSKKWGFVPDYARLDIIYENGGIYLDTDVELIKGMDDLLINDAFAGFETGNTVALGLGFGAQAGNSVIKLLRDSYEKISFLNDDGSLNLTSSPSYQTDDLKTIGLICNGQYQELDGITIYPEKALCAKSMYTMCTQIKDYTYSIHHYDGSWAEDKARQFNIRLGKDLERYFHDTINAD